MNYDYEGSMSWLNDESFYFYLLIINYLLLSANN